MHEHDVAGCDAVRFADECQRGQALEEGGGGGGGGEVGGDADDVGCGDGAVFGVGGAAEPGDARARVEVRGGVGAEGDDVAGGFAAEGVGEGGGLVEAGAEVAVCEGWC